MRNFKYLFHKYWLEGSTKFLIAGALLVLIVVYALSGAAGTIEEHPRMHAGRQINFTQYVWVIIYKGYFLTVFTLSAFIFGVGSPSQEKASGSALFILSLPVTRNALIKAKLCAAFSQVALLSFLMAALIPLLSILFGFTYPLKDAVFFGLLMTAGGIFFAMVGFGLSLLISKGNMVIPLGAAMMATLFFVTKIPLLHAFNIFNFMIGAGFLSNETFLFNHSPNLLAVAGFLISPMLAFLLFEAILRRMDF